MAEKLTVEQWAAVFSSYLADEVLEKAPADRAEEGYTEAETTEMMARSYLLAGVNIALNRGWNDEQTADYLEELARRIRSGEARAAVARIQAELLIMQADFLATKGGA